MRVTVIKDDNIIGVDGEFRPVTVTGMPEGVRVIQWDGEKGEMEYYDNATPNSRIDTIDAIQSFIDLWNAAAPPPPPAPTPEELKAAAHARINAAYGIAVNMLTAGYPENEIASWPKQETEARAWLLDNASPTPWIDSAATARGMSKPDFIALVIGNADALAPLHGALSGKRQYLRDQIDALGDSPTPEQLNAIQW